MSKNIADWNQGTWLSDHLIYKYWSGLHLILYEIESVYVDPSKAFARINIIAYCLGHGEVIDTYIFSYLS